MPNSCRGARRPEDDLAERCSCPKSEEHRQAVAVVAVLLSCRPGSGVLRLVDKEDAQVRSSLRHPQGARRVST